MVTIHFKLVVNGVSIMTSGLWYISHSRMQIARRCQTYGLTEISITFRFKRSNDNNICNVGFRSHSVLLGESLQDNVEGNYEIADDWNAFNLPSEYSTNTPVDSFL